MQDVLAQPLLVADTVKNWRWGDAEVESSEPSDQLYLRGRLELVASRGYAGALAWSTKARSEKDNRTDWKDETRDQVKAFAFATPVKP